MVLEYVRSDEGKDSKQVYICIRYGWGDRSREVYLGLTGNDWPDKGVSIVVWRLTVGRVQLNNDVLAEKESFMWSKR